MSKEPFATQGEAAAYARWKVTQAHTAGNHDARPLFDLCKQWYELHGIQLKDGARRLRKLELICEAMGQPTAGQFNAAAFTGYRATRLQDTSPATTNRELSYLKAVFNELRRCGEWDSDNPLEFVRPIRIDEAELSYLTRAQITALLADLQGRDSHAYITSKVCLATGARWGEPLALLPRHVRDGRVTFVGTKSGKTRAVPVAPELAAELRAALPLADGLGAFRRSVARLGIALPAGQLTHVLRHTFASHFVMRGGSILTLQKILGHSTVQVTMRYAHLAPDHLLEAVALNPLNYE